MTDTSRCRLRARVTMGCRTLSAAGMSVALLNWNSSASGRVTVVVSWRPCTLFTTGTGTTGTGIVLRDGGSGRVISSTLHEAAPLAWQTAIHRAVSVVRWGRGRAGCPPAVSARPENTTW